MKDESNRAEDMIVMNPHPRVYEVHTKYLFKSLPFTMRNDWVIDVDQLFAHWTGRCNSNSDILHQVIEILHEAKLIDKSQYEALKGSSAIFPILVQCNASIFHYQSPINIDTIVFTDLVAKVRKQAEHYMSSRIKSGFPLILSVSNESVFELQVKLHSDLWFPWVKGFEDDKSISMQDGMCDNRQLAWRHTPRLNQCLTELRQLVMDAGGTWKVGTENVHEQYQHMVTETGIQLNMPDDVTYLK